MVLGAVPFNASSQRRDDDQAPPLTCTSLRHILSKERLPVHWRTIWRGVFLYFLESLGVSFTTRRGNTMLSTVPGIPWKIIHIGWWPSCTLFVSVLQLSIKLQLYIGLPSKVWTRTFVWSSSWFVNDHNDEPSTSASLIKSTSGTCGAQYFPALCQCWQKI